MADTRVRDPFIDPSQQREAAMMGIYVFLATEVMLFGGLFAAILVTRFLHPREFVEASSTLHLWIGGLNTAILLTSSLFVAIAVRGARMAASRAAAAALGGAALLGLAFLGTKLIEYRLELGDGRLPLPGAATRFGTPTEHLFMNLYLVATGLHAVHVAIGLLLLLGVACSILQGALSLPSRAIVVTTVGLFWHLIDVVWVFLYPMLYLAR